MTQCKFNSSFSHISPSAHIYIRNQTNLSFYKVFSLVMLCIKSQQQLVHFTYYMIIICPYNYLYSNIFFISTQSGSDCEDAITCSRAIPGLIIDSFLLKQVFSILRGSFPGNISSFSSWENSGKYPENSFDIGHQLTIRDISGLASEISRTTTRMQLNGYILNAVSGTQYSQINGGSTIKPSKYAGGSSATGGQLTISTAPEMTSEISGMPTGIKPSADQWDVSLGKHQMIGISITQTSQYPENSSDIGGRLFKRSSGMSGGSSTKLNIETHPFVRTIAGNPKIGANLISSFLPRTAQTHRDSSIIIKYPKYCLGMGHPFIGDKKKTMNKISLCRILQLLGKPTKVGDRWVVTLRKSSYRIAERKLVRKSSVKLHPHLHLKKQLNMKRKNKS